MSVKQTLTVEEVANSASVAANTSKVRILWQSTQAGESWNGYTRSATYYVSVNGGAETAYTVSYTLPKNSTATIADATITVNHNSDGSAKVKVRTYMETGISPGLIELSKETTLTTIPRASAITSAEAAVLGSNAAVTWTPASVVFRYTLTFSVGSWTHTTGAIHPNTTSGYTYRSYVLPIGVVEQLSKNTGTMSVVLKTYKSSVLTAENLLGTSTAKTFTVTVPSNSDTQPTVSMELTPVHTLGEKFNGLYIHGKSKVKATLSAEGKYGADIRSYKMNVQGKDYSSPYESGYLTAGNATVTGYATDSREITGSTEQTITVLPYSKPKIQAAYNEGNVIAVRCDKDGNISDGGTFLKIKAKRSYYPIVVDGVQRNHCEIRYRYKAVQGVYSDWMTILAGDNTTTDEVTTAALLDGALATNRTYLVQVGVIDDVGESTETAILVPTDKVYWHRDGKRNSFTFGGYVEEDNTFAIASGVTFRPIGGIGKIALYDSNDFNDLVYVTGYYASTSAPSSAGCSNYPVNKTGVLEVISQMSQNATTGAWWGFAWQTYRTHDGGIYTRSFFTTNGWTPWVAHTGTPVT